MLHFGWTTQRTRFQVTAKVTQAEHLAAADKVVSAVVMHVKLNLDKGTDICVNSV